MPAVGIRDLSRRTGQLVEEVQRTGRPVIVTRNGVPVVALYAIDERELEDFVLTHAPEFAAGRREADADLADGRTRSLAEFLDDPAGD